MTSTVAEPPYTWDLDKQYPDDAAWLASLTSIRQRLAAFEKLRGTPIASARLAADRLDEVRYLRGRAGHMARFAIVHNQVDTSDAIARQRMDASTLLETAVERGVAWVDAVLIANGRDTLRSWIAREPRFQAHGWHLNRLLTLANHLPAAGTETAAAALSRATQSPTQVYDALMQSDLGWPSMTGADGKALRVDPDTWSTLSVGSDAALRKSANAAYLGRIKGFEDALGLLLTRRLGANLDLAELRGYRDAIDGFFAWNDGVPPGSYQVLIDAAFSDRALLERYAGAVARVHRLAPLNFGDLNATAPRVERTFTVAQAVDRIAASWAPLGAEYQATLRARLAKPWMDLTPRPHKDGVGVYWGVGGGDPYTVLSFSGDNASAKLLAEAAPTIMFYADLPPAKAPEQRDSDWPIYGNALWFLGQMRFDDGLLRDLEAAASPAARRERIATLYDNCRRLWARFFQYTIYLQLEQRIYASIERSQPMSGAQIAAGYVALLHEWYAGVRTLPGIEDAFGDLALLDSNAYYGEVLPEWAFAMASAAALSERVDAGDAATLEAIRHPLGRQDSYTSYELLRDAHVDIATAQPYHALARRFARLLDQLDEALQP